MNAEEAIEASVKYWEEIVRVRRGSGSDAFSMGKAVGAMEGLQDALHLLSKYPVKEAPSP